MKNLRFRSLIFVAIFICTLSSREFIWQISKTHRKQQLAKSEHLKEENPDALLQAFAEIKTGKDGRTYGPNYKVRELSKAKQRLALQRTTAVPLPWTERGPGNVSGRSRVIAVDPSDPTNNTWFIGAIGGGVWKTTDAGETWEEKTQSLSTLTVATLAIAESNPDIIYVGTGMGYGRIVDMAGSGVWKSVDHGETWIQLPNTANGELYGAINRIVVDPSNPDLVILCSNGLFSHLGPNSTEQVAFGKDRKSAIFRSTDGGDSWIRVFDPDVSIGPDTDNRVQQIIADPTNFNILYASVNEVGVIKSYDKGLTWEVLPTNFYDNTAIGVPQGNGLGLPGISARAELAIAPSDPNRIYASVERPLGEVADLYMSMDGGNNWTEVVDTGSDPNWFEQSGGVTRNAGWFDNTIIVNPYNENEVYVGGVNIYRAEIDPGTSTRITTPNAWWRVNNDGIPTLHADHHYMVTIQDDPTSQQFRILVTNDGGLGVSNNGESWTQIGGAGTFGLPTQPAGLNTTQFYGVDKKPGEKVYIGGMQDNNSYISSENPDNLSTWKFVTGGDGFEAVWNYDNPSLVISTSQFERLYRSTDGGVTFNRIPEASVGYGPFISKIGNSKSDPDLLFTIGTNGVKRSIDFGDTWTLTPIEGNWLGYRPFDNVEVSLANPQVVWITSRLDADPATGWVGGIHVSKDGGISFSEISQNFPPELKESSGLATHPSDPNTAYFLFSGPDSPKILKTTDLGETFEDISGFGMSSGRVNARGFPDVAVFSLLVMPYDEQIIWAGTEIGLFITEDGGASWNIADNRLPNAGIFQMSIVDGEILVATQGRGIWTVELPELATYTPPVVTKAPGLKDLVMHPDGRYYFTMDLRSSYDSTLLLINNESTMKFSANADPSQDRMSLAPTVEEVVSLQLVSYKDNIAYTSARQELLVFPVETLDTYTGRFDEATESNNYVLQGFFLGLDEGFSNSTLHTSHPYSDGAQVIGQLKNSIRVASSDATLSYRDIALVEPGIVDDYNDLNFWDYVIVEATNDGTSWLPLLDGYDARLTEQWNSLYNSGFSGPTSTGIPTEDLFVQHEINLLDYFAPGDEIFIRFRLSADGAANGWGWAIDDLVIQENLISSLNNKAESSLKLKVFPNPVTDIASIQYYLREYSAVNLKVLDLSGRVLQSTQFSDESKGYHSRNVSLSHLKEGMYILVIEAHGEATGYRVIKK